MQVQVDVPAPPGPQIKPVNVICEPDVHVVKLKTELTSSLITLAVLVQVTDGVNPAQYAAQAVSIELNGEATPTPQVLAAGAPGVGVGVGDGALVVNDSTPPNPVPALLLAMAQK